MKIFALILLLGLPGIGVADVTATPTATATISPTATPTVTLSPTATQTPVPTNKYRRHKPGGTW